MAFKLEYEATSDRACVVDVLGEFKAGETKTVTETELDLFEKIHGHKLAASQFARWFHLTVMITGDTEEVA